jgi:hypothetical protein
MADDTAIAPAVDAAFAEAEFDVFEPPVVWFISTFQNRIFHQLALILWRSVSN